VGTNSISNSAAGSATKGVLKLKANKINYPVQSDFPLKLSKQASLPKGQISLQIENTNKVQNMTPIAGARPLSAFHSKNPIKIRKNNNHSNVSFQSN